MMAIGFCEHCIFFEMPDDPDDAGECRRHAPRAVVRSHLEMGTETDVMKVFSLWPVVLDTDWCGEFQPRG